MLKFFERKRRPPRDQQQPVPYTLAEVTQKIEDLPAGVYGLVLVKTAADYYAVMLDLARLEQFFNESFIVSETGIAGKGEVGHGHKIG